MLLRRRVVAAAVLLLAGLAAAQTTGAWPAYAVPGGALFRLPALSEVPGLAALADLADLRVVQGRLLDPVPWLAGPEAGVFFGPAPAVTASTTVRCPRGGCPAGVAANTTDGGWVCVCVLFFLRFSLGSWP